MEVISGVKEAPDFSRGKNVISPTERAMGRSRILKVFWLSELDPLYRIPSANRKEFPVGRGTDGGNARSNRTKHRGTGQHRKPRDRVLCKQLQTHGRQNDEPQDDEGAEESTVVGLAPDVSAHKVVRIESALLSYIRTMKALSRTRRILRAELYPPAPFIFLHLSPPLTNGEGE